MSTAMIEQSAGKVAARYAGRRAERGRPVKLNTQSHNPTSRRPGWITYAILSFFLLLFVFPLYTAAMYGSATQLEIASASGTLPRFFPTLELFRNFATVVSNHQFSFWRATLNSLIVSLIAVASTVFFSTLAGFAFAKLNFRGKNLLYLILIATMAIPGQIGVIPMFLMMNSFGWIDSLLALIVPGLVGAFGIFWMTQYLSEALPYELIEAARVDGASLFRTFWSVALPAARPAAATLGLFTFVGSWNSFFWPSIILRTQNTLPMIIPQLRGAFTLDQSLVMSGVFLVALPLLIVFVFAGKQLVDGVMAGAVKG